MRYLPLLLLLVATDLVAAQPGGSPAPIAPIKSMITVGPSLKQPDEIVEVLPGTERMTSKIAFVIDASGSMDLYGSIKRAIRFAQDVIKQPNDDLLVTIFAFKEKHTRWPGVKPDEGELRFGPPPPKGWTEFPGVKQLESAEKWLMGQGADGGTDPSSAITAALALDMKNLTVVIITDGEFNWSVKDFLDAVSNGQADRVKRKLGKAVIFVIGTGAGAESQRHLVKVAKSGGGGLHIIRRPQSAPEKLKTQEK